jgi:5-methylcytosine-specific restriction protein A
MMRTPCQGRCGALVEQPGLCPACLRRKDGKRRKDNGPRLYDSKWAKESKLFLRANPFCVCERRNPLCNGEAKVTDHRIPHKGDPARFWDRTNWQPMSKVCHDQKTALEDGGFGNSVRQAGE